MSSVDLFGSDRPSEILGEEGVFSRSIDGFTARKQQQEMADAVNESLHNSSVFVVEAGTGTGKTFAYLVPALLTEKRVIISTGTKTLQDQLFKKDIPLVKDVMQVSFRAALLKGRANYLCRYRFSQTETEGRFSSRAEVSHLKKISRWKARTKRGDISEVSAVPEDSMIWSKVTSTGDSCMGKECDCYQECFVAKARREAMDADIIVVNHHLLFADISLKSDGFGEILPDVDAYIIDEAHQVPEVASDFLGVTISSRQINDLFRDVEIEYYKECGDVDGFIDDLDKTKKSVNDFRLAFGVDGRKAAWDDNQQEVVKSFSDMKEKMVGFADKLDALSDRGKGMENCHARLQEILDMINQFNNHESAENESIKWFEVFSKSFILKTTPLDVSDNLREIFNNEGVSWIFTSATLSVNGNFDHYLKTIGVEDAQTLLLSSPFDYSCSAVLYSPLSLPMPAASDYTQALLEEVVPLLNASKGRAFLLFTSYRALDIAADILSERIEYPIFVQGQMSKGKILDKFREKGNAVLLGTGSFWEGVDVKGGALSLVVIDKLPFSSPGDPVMQARIDAINKSGGNAFMDYQLPKAVITLKQGVGRLIRDSSDKGVMVIADPRLLTKSYGKTFIHSLPAMAKTRRKDGVIRFLEGL
ncbi:MAG: ATP-dependent DNA helicase [Gammaproteobacteria bacterium]|nr:MAG: ATP-dependent DNA helicase [Gammaproteobacteria bacterium]